MAQQARGIEVFGRGATTVERRSPGRPTRRMGVLALLLACAATVVLVLAIIANAERADTAMALAITAMVLSALGVLLGLGALLGNRGRVLGLCAVVLGAAANPWLLTRALEYLQSLAFG